MRLHKTRSPRALLSPVPAAVVLLMAGAGVARGQAVEALPAAQAAAAAAPSTTTPPATQEIVITATKRSTSLQKTPVAVTSIGAAELEKAQVQTMSDVVHLVPSFQATTQGDHGVITMTMRGIGNDSAKTEYADPEVALFVNGIYSPRAEGAAALLFDLESIEVLRGPQGTLWGRNSTVGAVNMQTARPVLGERSASLDMGLGNYHRQGLRGSFNVPLSDTMALRFAAVHEQHDGYVNYQRAPHISIDDQRAAAQPVIDAWNTANPDHPIGFQALNPNIFVQGGPKYNAQDQTAARLSLLWKPSKDFSWNLSYEQFQDRGTPNMNLMQTPRAGEDFWSALIDTAPYLHRDVSTFRSRIDYNLGNDMSLAYIAGYSHFSGKGDFDQDGGARVPTSFTTGATFQEDRTNWSDYKNHSHELDLQSTGNREVDWILGLYYAAEDNGIRFDIPIMNGTQQGTVGWQGSFIQPKETVESQAVFGQATWNLSEALHLTGGVRYTRDKRTNEGGTNNGWAYDPTVPQTPVDPGMDPRLPGSGFNTYQRNDGSFSANKATWLARASYDLSRTSMVYASVSTGYKSGGLQDGGRPYGAETLTNYEVGNKATFFDGKLRWNNALYYERFKDFQFSAPVTNVDGTHSLATSNAEGAKVYGLESELAYKVGDDGRLQLALAYTHTELGHLIGGSNDYALPPCNVPGIGTCLDVTGNELPHAPKGTIQLGYEHTFHLPGGDTLAPRISVHYETASWLSVFNMGDGDRQKAYTRTDLGLRYASHYDWYADLYVRNVEDGKVRTNAQNSFGTWQSQYLAPRTFGVNFGVNF